MQKKDILPKEFKHPHILSGLDKSASILVGFSGGADSSALLFMLNAYSKESGAKIYAAHLNHGIRGEEADRDERFCREFAASLGIEFFSLRLDIPRMAKESGESVESIARRARYDFFDKIMSEHSISILATAHNADDNLETVIFNLSRGTGLSGLCGIPATRPTSQGIVIRPILSMEKKDIIAFCEAHGINYVTDSTNADNDYTRNKIRNQIIPLLKEINSGIVKNTTRTTESLKNDAVYLQSEAESFVNDFCKEHSIDTDVLCSAPPTVANRALMEIYKDISSGETLEAVHISAIKELAKKAVPHSSVSLPKEIDAVIENQKLCFMQKKEATTQIDYNIHLSDGKNTAEEAKIDIFVNIEPYSKNIYKKSILLSIESAKIKGSLMARSRRSGDKILVGGVHKSLKKLLNEKKIPLELRSRIPIIYDDSGIVAIPFVAIRDGARAAKNEYENKQTKITVCIR